MSRLSAEDGAPVVLRPGGVLRGTVSLPGDKSLSHRALIFGALAPGELLIDGISRGGDVRATASALRALGVPISSLDDAQVRVGDPDGGQLREPGDVLDCGNSGTSMRLLAGLLAGQPFLSVLSGDGSLRRRPMARVVEPLRRMGAWIDGRDDARRAPLVVRGGGLRGIDHSSPVASAQVKSCLLLAGLFAEGELHLKEPHRSRDHTERMLLAHGVELERTANTVRMICGQPLRSLASPHYQVAADISASAFFVVAAAIRPGSELLVPGVGINPSRDGLLDVLDQAGVSCGLERRREVGGEPIADLRIHGAELRPFEIGGALIPRLIDEIPALAVLAACAPGLSRIRDAAELKAKESDRIASTAALLRAFGVTVRELPDGLEIEGRGGQPFDGGGAVHAGGDHRIGMSAAVAALAAKSPATLYGAAAIDSSFPGFFAALESCLEP